MDYPYYDRSSTELWLSTEIWRQQNNQTSWPGKKFPKLTVETFESDWYNLDTSCNYVSYGRIMNETAIWNQKFRMNLYQYDWITIACVSETILYKKKLWGVKVQNWLQKNYQTS